MIIVYRCMFASMHTWKAGDRIKLNPEVLEDQSRKSLHHSFKRIIEEDREGVVMEESELINFPGRWVKFIYGRIVLKLEQVHIIGL